jgi:hypothetical protein
MTKAERENRTHTYNALMRLGFTFDECEKMRRISMTLHRWHELECGDSNSFASWAIERDEETKIPYIVKHLHGQGVSKTYRTRIPDRETGARRRLSEIIKTRNERTKATPVETYIQGDPRGAALYILRPDDVPEGKDPAAYYSRGICIY